jgi:hypothetical protein
MTTKETPSLRPKELRWWFEEWQPKHRPSEEGCIECDCNACHPPLLWCIRQQFSAKLDPPNYHGITVNYLEGLAARSYVHRTLKLLERQRLIHGCYALGRQPISDFYSVRTRENFGCKFHSDYSAEVFNTA